MIKLTQKSCVNPQHSAVHTEVSKSNISEDYKEENYSNLA